MHEHAHTPSNDAPKERDPVCGMEVDPKTARHRASYGGREYVLCSASCREKLLASPEKYVSAHAHHHHEAHDHASHAPTTTSSRCACSGGSPTR